MTNENAINRVVGENEYRKPQNIRQEVNYEKVITRREKNSFPHFSTIYSQCGK